MVGRAETDAGLTAAGWASWLVTGQH